MVPAPVSILVSLSHSPSYLPCFGGQHLVIAEKHHNNQAPVLVVFVVVRVLSCRCLYNVGEDGKPRPFELDCCFNITQEEEELPAVPVRYGR